MKTLVRTCIILLAISSSGFAAHSKSVMINFSAPVRVGQYELRPGDYFVKWTLSGTDAQVSFFTGVKLIASVPAKMVPSDNVAATRSVPNGVEVDTKQEGATTVLAELQFSRMDLVFQHAPSGEQP